MGVRSTSIEAYNYIKENGLLSKRRLEIYEILFTKGPLTAGEIGRAMPNYRAAVSTADRNIHARLAELRDMLAIQELGTKICEVTGMEVILWDVTDRIPVKLEKEAKQRIWYAVFGRFAHQRNMIFKTKEAAFKYKVKENISAPIHEFIEG